MRLFRFLFDPLGIEWTGEYFLLKYDRGLYKLNGDLEKLVPFQAPVPGIHQITFDGRNFYAIGFTGYAPPRIYKFTNIW